jgi:hypothetical protein
MKNTKKIIAIIALTLCLLISLAQTESRRERNARLFRERNQHLENNGASPPQEKNQQQDGSNQVPPQENNEVIPPP